MQFVYPLPSETEFDGDGLFGYNFAPLKQKDVDVYYIEVTSGHDTFMISKKITRIYYIISGDGYFTIENQKYDVGPGMLVEVPPKVEYSYSGTMKILAFSRPRWFGGNDNHTRYNPDVFGAVRPPPTAARRSPMARLAGARILGKSPVGFGLRLGQRAWDRLSPSATGFGPIRHCGNGLHGLAKLHGTRGQAFSTFFLRNRPQLELVGRLVARAEADCVRVAVLGSSTGAEAYSLAWTIRSARPDLRLLMHAVDISRRAVDVARRGVYSRATRQVTNTDIFERMTVAEIEELFDRDGDVATVKPWIREGIEWRTGDAGAASIVAALGAQDIVVANNFLCHMQSEQAEQCLRNIARLVKPNGYLLVSGIDLDIRTKVADDLGWQPVAELLEEIHEGDPCLRQYWPCHYAGLEPMNKKRPDWRRRYAAAFRLGRPVPTSETVALPTVTDGRRLADRRVPVAASVEARPARGGTVP